jgi:dihydroorotase
MSSVTSVELPLPDDFHHHFRDGVVLGEVVKHAARSFGRAIAMPNLKPPVRTLADAVAYKERIHAQLPAGSQFNAMMTIYLTDTTT